MNQTSLVSLIVILVVLIIGGFSIFTVDEREKAIKFKFGEIISTDFKPGIHFQIPIVNNVRKFDSRIQTMDSETERYLTKEKKNVLVDAFVKWRIDNVAKYYTSTSGGEVLLASDKLSQIIKKGLRDEFGKRTIQEVVSGERREIMDILSVQANEAAKEFGIDIVDVRIKRIDLDKDVSDSVYRRMEAERTRVAKDLRARGEEEAERIRANTDRQRTIITAEAFRDAEIVRGEGDKMATAIYAKAFGQDKEFYDFYRSLQAYRASFANKNDILVLEPKSDFFKYFNKVK